MTQTVDARGASGTVYVGYDGLNRPVWRNTTNSPTGSYVSYSYDQTTGHGFGVGHVTTETFTNSAGGSGVTLSGSHSYTYDARGQVTGQTDAVAGVGSNFAFAMAYNDAGQPTSLTYSDGEVLGTSYNAQGWLNRCRPPPAAAVPSRGRPASPIRAWQARRCSLAGQHCQRDLRLHHRPRHLYEADDR